MLSRGLSAGLIVVGIGLTAFALLAGSSARAPWSLIAVSIPAIILGARGLRRESISTALVIAICAGASIAVLGNFRVFGINALIANAVGAGILMCLAALALIPGTRHRLKL